MKKLILIGLLSLSSTLFASSDLGVRVQTNVGKTIVDVGFRSDDHRYDRRYKNFNYRKYGYFDNYGYYFGYFDRTGYFFNNIFFLYNSRYTYYDRLHRRGYFRPDHIHFRKYKYTKGNDWNKIHKYRKENEKIYGHYYNKNPNPKPMQKYNKNIKTNQKFKNEKHMKKNDRFKNDRKQNRRDEDYYRNNHPRR
ncbi:hypothetical protein [Halarcobacter anaerophilus]|jgi:hypothetical protein|uniref:hypothetical protein n=1 Tax=Halarcobacter anaerophilus TaxID=877500 RepID=UPI0005C8B725|nr:hypothetical protein [Halarcobacter anaerophilus]